MMCMSYWYNDILEYVLWYGGESRILSRLTKIYIHVKAELTLRRKIIVTKWIRNLKSSDVLHRPIEVTSSSTKAQMIQ